MGPFTGLAYSASHASLRGDTARHSLDLAGGTTIQSRGTMRGKSLCPCWAAAGRLSRNTAKTKYRNMPDNAQNSHLIPPISPRARRNLYAGEIRVLLRAAACIDREIR